MSFKPNWNCRFEFPPLCAVVWKPKPVTPATPPPTLGSAFTWVPVSLLNCCEVYMVKDVVSLDPQLRAISLFEVPHLFQRHVHILIVRPCEQAAGCVTERSVGGGSQNPSVLDVASAIGDW